MTITFILIIKCVAIKNTRYSSQVQSCKQISECSWASESGKEESNGHSFPLMSRELPVSVKKKQIEKKKTFRSVENIPFSESRLF